MLLSKPAPSTAAPGTAETVARTLAGGGAPGLGRGPRHAGVRQACTPAQIGAADPAPACPWSRRR
jgi:hypothetical protein